MIKNIDQLKEEVLKKASEMSSEDVSKEILAETVIIRRVLITTRGHISSIKNYVLFFVVLTVLSMIAGFLIVLVS